MSDIITKLREKANNLPMLPGVYIMKNERSEVIYVGKAKKLKNRVTSYFRGEHLPKVEAMVQKVADFDVIIAGSEFEALVLENSLIKRHMPHYNILLRDDKGYPYIRVDFRQEYPTLTLSNSVNEDGAEYFGPFGSRGVTNALIEAINDALQLPHCSLRFPRDIGKRRACLHFHMKQCLGWCQEPDKADQYRLAIDQARMLLQGNYKRLADEIRKQMLTAADDLEFELAAGLRDRLDAIEKLSQKQLVATDSFADVDVIGFSQTDVHACFSVLHFVGGNLMDKDYEIFSTTEDPGEAVSSLLKQYYISRGTTPKVVFLPFEVDDSDLFEEYALQNFGRKVRFKVPQRGDNKKLVELANKNAHEEAQRITDKDEKSKAVINNLAKMLELPTVRRIESFDISNISGTDIVASMVVFEDGKPCKSAYKKFKINDLDGQDDYASMRQVLLRRYQHMKNGDQGFAEQPNLILIDGGVNHAKIAQDALAELNLTFPVFGMVKDDHHKTRALITQEGKEIRIDNQQSIFALIGRIQDETHRFAITYHKKLRSKRLRYSALDKIPGVGPKRKAEILKAFGSLAAIKDAELADLQRVLPANVANSVYQYFKRGE